MTNGLIEPMDDSVGKTDVVCLVLRDADGRMLAARRPLEKSLGGLWEFPGGKVDPGESPETALRREIREELCLELTCLSPLATVTHAYDFGVIHLLPYLASCDRRPPEIRLTEHTEHRWVSPEEALALEWAPADLPVLAMLR